MSELPRTLPVSFTYVQARAAGLAKNQVYRLRDQGVVEQIGRAVFRRIEDTADDPDLTELAHRAPGSALCLATALAWHGLLDFIPPKIDIALPRSRRPPAVQARVHWHRFDTERFQVGRETIAIADTEIGLYNAERSLIDMFRLRHTEGEDLAFEALRRWLRDRGTQPSTLLRLASTWWPRTVPALERTIEIMR
ncbi:type IV toxin-antitoxin system AbiEi family antitoxin domain-containing protein [Sciscionella sediminilitoris]|uniref:type IV toxin-antitoxin system AbiEi family antitoxin domain-containing protein n=1 Tax=Sciscionella sediminilitoris TaxID=1445613 RepID=UPI0004DF6296|nr:hypothetical protein [Sciscionella sp. SE31]